MNEREIAAILFGAAQDQAQRHGLKLGGGADDEIRRRAKNGAELVLQSIGQAGASEASVVAAASTSFRRLVDAMAAARSQIPGYADQRGDVIGEETLGRALGSLCPIWPIC